MQGFLQELCKELQVSHWLSILCIITHIEQSGLTCNLPPYKYCLYVQSAPDFSTGTSSFSHTKVS